MSLNDSAIANNALHEWSTQPERERTGRVTGAKMYFARMQMGHAFEALEIVREISESALLLAAVNECDSVTRASFATVEAFLDTNDYKTLRLVRNNLSFHYSRSLSDRAFRRVAKASPTASYSHSLGTRPIDWHFELADRVIDSIMVRDVLKVPEGISAQPATDEALARLWEVQVKFADFAGYFARHHTSQS
ncbi:MAG TPA: hypothetical protein VIN06_19325 [Devosia sp.]